MKDLVSGIKRDALEVVNQAVGPKKEFCMGYLTPTGASGGEGYITTLKLSVGTVDVRDLDAVTERFVAHNRCEKNDAYMGQVNIIKGSSYCGLNGALWGFDLVLHDDIARHKGAPIYTQAQPEGAEVPVYNIRPLLEATERLFGKEGERRFPLMPGVHVPCASKSTMAFGPLWAWSAIGIAIPKDRDANACLIMTDADVYGDDSTTEGEIIGFLEGVLRKVTNSIVLCGADEHVEYERIYVGYKYIFAEENQVGAALACAPFIYLAQDAIPKGMKASDLCKLSVSEWEKKLDLEPLTIFE